MSGPMILGLDSCGQETSLALGTLAGGGEVMAAFERVLGPRTAGAQLTRALGEILSAAALRPQDLQALVVVRGPGSFTGMRVGLSAVKAIAQVTGVPVVGMSRLAVLALTNGTDAAALHAGRGNVFLRHAGEEELLPLTEAAARVSGEPVAVCEERLLDSLGTARLAPEPKAMDAIRFAVPRLLEGEYDEPASLDALYLWREEEMLRAPVPRS